MTLKQQLPYIRDRYHISTLQKELRDLHIEFIRLDSKHQIPPLPMNALDAQKEIERLTALLATRKGRPAAASLPATAPASVKLQSAVKPKAKSSAELWEEYNKLPIEAKNAFYKANRSAMKSN